MQREYSLKTYILYEYSLQRIAGALCIRSGLYLLVASHSCSRLPPRTSPASWSPSPVDESSLVTLHGTVHPLVRSGIDRGRVADSFPTGRMLLLLNRPPDRQAALQQFLLAVHTHGAASYHAWLTPEQFGQQFGPSDTDIESASAWLVSHGLRIAGTSKSRQFIEFSGNAGAVRDAFHTEIHQYTVNGETHYANAGEIKIPAALAPLIGGVSPINDFRAKPMLQVLGQATYSQTSHTAAPQFTLSNGSSKFYALAPEDFATQYDLAPLYKAGVNGAGQTIGIINESNINLSLVQAYQKLFSLSSAAPQLVIDGSDPGDLQDVDIEAYLDVEEAGAVAPGAPVNLYIGNASGLFTGNPSTPKRSSIRSIWLPCALSTTTRPACSASAFGNCEGFMLHPATRFGRQLWQQAAAQGQTVVVSSGDSGSAGCDNANDQWTTEYGLAVNGLASTPWNIAVGGTDFYYSDYASGGASIAGLWNQTNDADNGSLKAPLPEQVWDTVYGFNAIGPYVQVSNVSIPAGGGGASSCIYSAEKRRRRHAIRLRCNSSEQALYGYAKPSWQCGTGAPNDGVRDLPDVSLFRRRRHQSQRLSHLRSCR